MKYANSARGRGKRPKRDRKISTINDTVKVPKDYIWKVLSCVVDVLESTVLPETVATMRGVIRSRSFDRLKEVTERWGLQSMNASSFDVAALYEYKARYMLSSLAKKFCSPDEGESQKRREEAMKKFMASEVQCKVTNLALAARTTVDGTLHPWVISLRNDIAQLFGATPPESSELWSRHGPGSDTATFRGQHSTYDKYADWPYAVTDSARGLAKRLILSDERWFGALEDSYREDTSTPKWTILDWDEFWDAILREEDGNRITTVPKDWSTDRPIAIEPRMNMLLQLGVDGVIRRKLRSKWHINLDSRYKNHRLCIEGSIREDADSPVTIDLQSASDTVSFELAKLLLPSDWFEYMCMLRSPRGLLPTGELVTYEKISSMGNGYTFALESLIFAAIARLAVRISTAGTPDYKSIAIIGDDIIVPASASGPLLMLLSLFGFTVNSNKTFLSGKVRESCGVDMWNGYNVRPVHLKVQPRKVSDLLAHRNLLHRWFCLHFGGDTTALDQLYLSWIPPAFHNVVGPYSDTEFDTYWHVPKAPSGSYKNWSYVFRCIKKRNDERKDARKLPFRKLMASLRAAENSARTVLEWYKPPQAAQPWLRVSEIPGCLFKVPSKRETHVLGTRRSPTWAGEYYLSIDSSDDIEMMTSAPSE